jgi:hypothetical protein
MSYRFIDEEIAEQQLRIINEFGYSSNFMTIWKGKTVSFVFDKITGSVINISYPDYLNEPDLLFLEDLAIEFLEGE